MTAPSRSRRLRALAVLLALSSLVAACGDDDAGDASSDPSTATDASDADAPHVVVSTSWVAAFARAAGVDEVTIVAPVNLQHPPDYDPRPSDLAAVADADYVLLAGFEGFAERLTEATGSNAEVITINAENTPETIRAEVRALAEELGTTDEAEAWIAAFDERIAELQADLDAARPEPAPTVVAHVFMAYWADFAGLDVVGTYGPAPATASQLAELTAAAPDLLFANAHVPAGATFDDLGAVTVDIVNFPGPELDLLWVFETNTAAIVAAFESL